MKLEIENKYQVIQVGTDAIWSASKTEEDAIESAHEEMLRHDPHIELPVIKRMTPLGVLGDFVVCDTSILKI